MHIQRPSRLTCDDDKRFSAAQEERITGSLQRIELDLIDERHEARRIDSRTSTLAIHEAIANDRDGVAIVRVIVIPQMSPSPFVPPSPRGCAAP
jgi:hypothetical protein